MRLASTFHSLTAISTQFAPAKNSRGINYVLAETVSIHSYRTITGSLPKLHFSLGINFLVISNPTVPYLEGLLDEIYVLFADYVMKVPCHPLFLLESVL